MISFEKYTNSGGRKGNEDNAVAAFRESGCCFAVADGLGGHGGGEIASKLAVDAVCEEFLTNGWSPHFFENVFHNAQAAVIREQDRFQRPSGMKTTLVVLVIWKNRVCWAHVGDSRLYYYKDLKLKKRTLDHSVPQMLALSGEIREEDIRFHPDRNHVLRVIGDRDIAPRYDAERPFRLSGNQDFLLCTDGFWEPLSPNALTPAARGGAADWVAGMTRDIWNRDAESLVELDNLTCIAVRSER